MKNNSILNLTIVSRERYFVPELQKANAAGRNRWLTIKDAGGQPKRIKGRGGGSHVLFVSFCEAIDCWARNEEPAPAFLISKSKRLLRIRNVVPATLNPGRKMGEDKDVKSRTWL
jgi:hypothetical protein